MSAVVADTHIAIWYLATPDKLSLNALAALDEADVTGGPTDHRRDGAVFGAAARDARSAHALG
jgi:hypothetical protein